MVSDKSLVPRKRITAKQTQVVRALTSDRDDTQHDGKIWRVLRKANISRETFFQWLDDPTFVQFYRNYMRNAWALLEPFVRKQVMSGLEDKDSRIKLQAARLWADIAGMRESSRQPSTATQVRMGNTIEIHAGSLDDKELLAQYERVCTSLASIVHRRLAGTEEGTGEIIDSPGSLPVPDDGVPDGR